MTRNMLVAGNWKMYKTAAETKEFCDSLKQAVKPPERVDVAVFPPFVGLPAAAASLSGSSIGLGGQNMQAAAEGAFTGEVSANMLLTVGCQYVILGHSERRTLFFETDSVVAEKVGAALKAGLTPVFCVGERLEERESGQTHEVISRQMAAVLESLDRPESLTVAYEPVWAIGTGKTATPEQAQEVHAAIRKQLTTRWGEAGAELKILYGGSVKPANAETLLSRPDIDGALVGGAALDVQSFLAIIEAAEKCIQS